MKLVERIAIFFGHVASNIGDIAINRGQVELLEAVYPDASIDVVLLDSSNSDYLTAARASFGSSSKLAFHHFQSYDINAFQYLSNPGLLLEEAGVANTDLICISSSEFLFEYELQANQKRLFWRMLPVLAAKSTGKKCVLLPSTFGPFETDASRGLAQAVLNVIDAGAVRESTSTGKLQNIGSSTKLPELLDPAFFIRPPDVRKAKRPDEGPVLGLALRAEDQGIRLNDDVKKARQIEFAQDGYSSSRGFEFGVQLISEFCDSTEKSVVLFVQTAADRALAEALCAWVTDNSVCSSISIAAPQSVDEYLSELSRVDLLASSRFHALILGSLVGLPLIPSYFQDHGHKVPGLWRLLGFSELPVNLTVDDLSAAAKHWVLAYTAKPSDLRVSASGVEDLRSRTRNWLSEVTENEFSVHVYRQLASALLPYADGLYDQAKSNLISRRTRPLKSEVNELNKKVKAITKQRDDLKKENRAITQEVERLEEEVGRLNDVIYERTRHSEEQAKRLDAQLEQIKTQSEENRYLSDYLEQVVGEKEAFEAESNALKESTSFRIGNLTVRIIRFPFDLIRGAMRYLVRVFSALRALLKKKQNKSTESPLNNRKERLVSDKSKEAGKSSVNDLMLRAFEASGIDGVLAQISESSSEMTEQDIGKALIALARTVRKDGDDASELTIMRKALEYSRSEAEIRMAFWAAQRAKDFWFASQLLDEIEAFTRENPTDFNVKKLENLKSSPIYMVSALSALEPRRESKFELNRNKIGYVLHNSLPFSSGGYATRSHGVVGGLKGAGYEVTVLTRPGFPLDIVSDIGPAEVPGEEVIDGTRYVRTLYPQRRGTPPKDYILEATRSLELRFAEEKPGLVIAASNHLTALPALMAARRLGIPFIYEVRGLWEVTRMSRESDFVEKPAYHIQRFLEKTVADEADHVLTLTGALKEELISRGVDGGKITLFPNSCDPERFSIQEKDEQLSERLGIPSDVPVIGYIGTFVQYEGLDDLTEACGYLKKRGIEFRLLLVGNENASGLEPGPITERILEIASHYGVGDWLIMPGRIPHEEVTSYYSLIDIAPFPRKPQPVCEMVSPMKPLEAFATQKAVLVSSVSALSEMVSDGTTGLVFDKGDIKDLSEKLEALIIDQPLRDRLGRAARAMVAKERTWQATIDKVVPNISTVIVSNHAT